MSDMDATENTLEQLQEKVVELERKNLSLRETNRNLKSQLKQLEDTKGINQISTGKKRKVKNQGREPRSKIQKYGSEHMQKWDELRQPHKNKRPRFKKKKETVRSSKGQTTRSQATKSHLAKRDGDASSSSSLDKDNVSSDASSVAEGSSSSNQEEPMLTASSASSDNESNI